MSPERMTDRQIHVDGAAVSPYPYFTREDEIVMDVLNGHSSINLDEVTLAERSGGPIPVDQLALAHSYVVAAEIGGVALPDSMLESIDQVMTSVKRMTDRHWIESVFRDYIPQIAAQDWHFWKFPYTEALDALAFETWPSMHIKKDLASALIGEYVGDRDKGERTYNSLVGASDSIGLHFHRVLETAETEGVLYDDNGKPVLTCDENGVRITSVVAALARDGYMTDEIFGEYDPSLLAMDQDDDRETSEHPELYEWYLRKGEWFVAEAEGQRRHVEDYELAWKKDGRGFTTMPYELDVDAQQFMYLSLYALVNLLGCKNAVYRTIYPMKRVLKRSKLKASQIIVPNTAVSNALFECNNNAIGPDQYHDGLEKSITIPTGKNSSVELIIVNEQPFDALVETYKLTPKHRFWLETAISIAYNDGKEPIWEITGADLLKFNGWSNPYQASAISTMKEAYNCIDTMASTLRIAIDTTREQKRFKGLKFEYELQNIIDGKMRIRKFDDGTEDFALILNRAVGPDPIDAFILARYAIDKKQVVVMSRADMEFKTVKRLRIDHRMMWRYVWRRVCEQKTSNTIVFDTIFKNIGLEDVTRQKRSQMLGVLKKMLKERRDQGRLTFDWNKKSNRDHSVTIHLAEHLNAIYGDIHTNLKSPE